MPATMDRPLTMPSDRERRRALHNLGDASRRVGNFRWRVWRYSEHVELEDEPREYERPPTFDEIGRVLVFVSDARSYLEEIGGYLDDIQKDAVYSTCLIETDPSAASPIG
jgi:hypothetical protein